MFTNHRTAEGVTHIQDAMGVSFTLIEGNERALLFDTGYGTEDVAAHIRTLTDKPVTVLLSHGHHDHMLGARWFEKTFLCQEDFEEFRMRSGEFQRKKVMRQAEERRCAVPDDFLTAEISMPEAIEFSGKLGRFDMKEEDLGGRTILAIHVPGHTPGSIVLYLPDEQMMLTGDDWNPCTWMWFPSSLAAPLWRENMKETVRLLEEENGMEIRRVLCSHQPMVRDGKEMKAFLAYMTDERMKDAPAVDMGAPIKTHQIVKESDGWVLVFDYDQMLKSSSL